jgi:fructose-1,6-bisphosphatase/inositol monophosphatase family enzyme
MNLINSSNLLNPPKQREEWVEILRNAANAGKIAIEKNYDFASRTRVIKRGAGGDLTLKIDEASESAIYKSLLRDLGEHSFVFVSEEVGEVEVPGNEPRPIVFCDPLDGSHNAQAGVPLFSISLAVLGVSRKMNPKETRHLGDVDYGLILNIPSGDEFHVIRNHGAYHNRVRISEAAFAPKDARFQTIGVECGDVDYLKFVIRNLTTKNVYKLRVLGSAAISYCMLANRTFDGFIFVQPNGARTIDSPAGYLIAKEAGRSFTDLSGKMKSLDQVELGFGSRLNSVGAVDRKTLGKLITILNSKSRSHRKKLSESNKS